MAFHLKPTLLGHLAGFGTFSSQSEVLCTQALCYLLKSYPQASKAFAEEIEQRTGLHVPGSVEWQAEVVQEDRARPDLEGILANGTPLVKIEAKLGAGFAANQLGSYQSDLLQRNDKHSALLVLVPKQRLANTIGFAASELSLVGNHPWRVSKDCQVGVWALSWDELFVILEEGKDDRLSHEIEQLCGMYHGLMEDYIAPIASAEELEKWESRETDYIKLVERATKELSVGRAFLPLQRKPEIENGNELNYVKRYVCQKIEGRECCYSIGVRDSFAEWITPIWLRFHKGTGNFKQIAERIQQSELRRLQSGGHLWMPLDIPIGQESDQMVASLVEQARAIESLAFSVE